MTITRVMGKEYLPRSEVFMNELLQNENTR